MKRTLAPLQKYILERKKRHQETSRKVTIGYNRLLRLIEQGNPEFKVEIISMWRNEGEPGIDITERRDLGELVAKATQKFNELNNRDDNQRIYSVQIISEDSACLLPENLYRHYVPKQNQGEFR